MPEFHTPRDSSRFAWQNILTKQQRIWLRKEYRLVRSVDPENRQGARTYCAGILVGFILRAPRGWEFKIDD